VSGALYGYTDVFQDSRKWMQEGKHDYLAPQIYWALGSKWPFNVILRDWLNNSGNRHVYGGMATYKTDVYPQTAAQIDTTRAQRAGGHIFFRHDNIASGNYAAIKTSYAHPANIPPMPWIDNIPTGAPNNLKVTKVDDKTYTLTWDKATAGTDGDTVQYYNIYRSSSSIIDYNDANNLFYITTNSDNSYTINYSTAPDRNYYFAVSALDRKNVESAPSNIVSVIVTGIADLNNPSGFRLEQNYPNPFNPATNIAFSLATKANVKLSIFNVLGQKIKTIVNDVRDAGRHVVSFNASNLPTGMYIYKIHVSAENKTYVDYKKMLLTK